MAFFVLFILLAILLGAGVMLAPALPSREPRIGLAATFCLALIVGGAVFWSYAFAWDTLVIDYLLFGLMSFVVLGGTLSQAQTRAEARGEDLSDADMGWTSRADLLMFLGLGLVCAAPLLLPNFQLVASAQAQIQVAQELQASQILPFEDATISIVLLLAYLSQQLKQDLALVYLAIGACVSFLALWSAYDFGSELRDKRLGRIFAAILIVGCLFLQWNGFYSLIMGLAFGLAFLTVAWRYYQQQSYLDLVGAGLLLGAVFLADKTLFWIFGAVYYLGLLIAILTLLREHRPSTWQTQIALWFGMSGIMLLATSPYWLKVGF